MLHGIINEQGNCLDVRDDFFRKNTIFSHVFFKSLASDALILATIVMADYTPMDLCYICYKYIVIVFITYILMQIILKYIEIQIENNIVSFV